MYLALLIHSNKCIAYVSVLCYYIKYINIIVTQIKGLIIFKVTKPIDRCAHSAKNAGPATSAACRPNYLCHVSIIIT